MHPTMMWAKPCDINGSYLAAAAAGGTGPTAGPQLMYCYTQPSVGPGPAAVDYGFLPASSLHHLPAHLQQHPHQLQQQQQLQQLAAMRSMAQLPVFQQQFHHIPQGALAAHQLPYPYQIQATLPPTPAHQQVAYLPTEQVFVNASRKRCSEEMLASATNTIANNNNNNAATDTSNDASDPKKPKLDQSLGVMKPGRVLHFRGIPADTTASEIIQLAIPFGQVTNVVLAKKKNQALLEMAEVSAARNAVNFYSQRAPLIRNRVIHVQVSNHDQLITEASAQGNEMETLGQSSLASVDGTMEEMRTVLRVIVENMLYSITLDQLKEVFSRYGQVMKIVTFSKNNSFQALIQFIDPLHAHAAKMALNGQNMYNNCCTLRVDFSKLPGLNVRFNNDKSRDYTNPLLPSGDGTSTSPFEQGTTLTMAPIGNGGVSAQMVGLPGYASMIYATAGPNGDIIQFGHPGGMPISAAALAASGIILTAGGVGPTSTVLLVSSLNEEKVTPDALFTLFGVYGDVIRVKIMFNKKDTALIQFNDPTQAHIAMVNLDKLKLWGKQIKVTPSKHNIVQMPKDGQSDAGLTKDYINSSLHRFKKPNSKNYHNIFPPSCTLHLSNIPSTSKEKLMELFSEYGTVVGFKFFQKDCKMALLQMSTIEEAANALIEMHNYQLAETSHLRVSFSKSTVTPQMLPIENLPQQQLSLPSLTDAVIG